MDHLYRISEGEAKDLLSRAARYHGCSVSPGEGGYMRFVFPCGREAVVSGYTWSDYRYVKTYRDFLSHYLIGDLYERKEWGLYRRSPECKAFFCPHVPTPAVLASGPEELALRLEALGY